MDRLLAKRPEDRPRDAAEVAEELLSFAGLGSEAWEATAGGGTTLDALPASRPPSPVLRLPEGESAGMSSAIRGRKLPFLGLVAVLLALTGTAGYLLRGNPPEPLRIALPAPQVSPDGDESFGLVSSAVLTATLSTLASLEGLAPLDSPRSARPLPGDGAGRGRRRGAAMELAPGDPRPLVARFRIALAGGCPDEAEEAFAALTQLTPGDRRTRSPAARRAAGRAGGLPGSRSRHTAVRDPGR